MSAGVNWDSRDLSARLAVHAMVTVSVRMTPTTPVSNVSTIPVEGTVIDVCPSIMAMRLQAQPMHV